MSQIFIFGSSNVYGVGGENGGWADLIKQNLHQKMYARGGIGEKIEIYNFGKSGATVEFVLETFPNQIKYYANSRNVISIVSVGGNNSKALDSPDNLYSTIEQYESVATELIQNLTKYSNYVLVVNGTGYYDETKTYPIISSRDGHKTYFRNDRKREFDIVLKKICLQYNAAYIDVDVTQEVWLQKYIHIDGLHPNSAGHELIAGLVLKQLEKIIPELSIIQTMPEG